MATYNGITGEVTSMAAMLNILGKEIIVGGKYRLVRKIGSGSFGDIFLGINISNGEVRATIYVLEIKIYLLHYVRKYS